MGEVVPIEGDVLSSANNELQVCRRRTTIPGRWYNRFSISSNFITEIFSLDWSVYAPACRFNLG